MEINKDFLTLLTPDGEFLRAFNQNYQYEIGQEIDFYPFVQEEGKKLILFDFFKSFNVKAGFSIAVVFILIVGTMFLSFGKDEVYAYMSIDANPSIELGINEEFQVIELLPYNKEGKQIIANIYDWKKKNVHELTSEIVQEMKKQGFINDKHAVLLSTVSEKEVQLAENIHWKKEMAEIEEIIQKENLELKIVEGSKEERAMAKEKGITTGQYKEKQLKASTSTSQVNENTQSIKPSKLESRQGKEVKFEQEKKTEAKINVQKEKQVPSPQARKKEQNIKQVPFEQDRKKEQWEKRIPPGQEKKQERIEKEHSSEWDKQNNKWNKIENNKVNQSNWKKEKKQVNQENNHKNNQVQTYRKKINDQENPSNYRKDVNVNKKQQWDKETHKNK